MSQTIFIERQYFSDGKRTEFFSLNNVTRPDWLPSMDSYVGIANTEAELKGDDGVFEFARIEVDLPNGAVSACVTWLGYFKRTADQKLGDRGAAAGVGMWVVNGTVDESVFVDNAENFLKRVVEIEDSFKPLATTIIESAAKTYTPFYQAKSAFGLSWGRATNRTTKVYLKKTTDEPDTLDAVNALFFEAKERAGDAANVSRYLCFMGSNTQIKLSPVLDLPDAKTTYNDINQQKNIHIKKIYEQLIEKKNKFKQIHDELVNVKEKLTFKTNECSSIIAERDQLKADAEKFRSLQSLLGSPEAIQALNALSQSQAVGDVKQLIETQKDVRTEIGRILSELEKLKSESKDSDSKQEMIFKELASKAFNQTSSQSRLAESPSNGKGNLLVYGAFVAVFIFLVLQFAGFWMLDNSINTINKITPVEQPSINQ
jgi:hypothetical protein